MSKVALIYDRVNTSYGGAEEVLLALKKAFPQADLFTSLYNPKKAKWAKDFNVKTSFLQKIPFIKNKHRLLAVFMPLAFENLDLSNYDIIISVTSAEAKGVITRKDQLHICYLLTPPRYLYHYRESYINKSKLLSLPIINELADIALEYLKEWDQIAIYRPDIVIPISEAVAKRVKKYHHFLPKTIIYPPVDTKISQNFYLPKGEVKAQLKTDSDYYLVVSRLVPYKNIDLAIKAAVQLRKKLLVIGEGPQEKYLKKLARKLERKAGFKKEKLIIFKKKLHPKILAKTYLNTTALLMPGIDDFGITALEANLYGRPVLINQESGAAELITEGKTGIKMKYQEKANEKENLNNLILALKKLEKTKFNAETLSKNALKYDTNSFVRNFTEQVNTLYDQKLKGEL